MERILVALDGSDHSDRALGIAARFASGTDAELILVHVLSDRPLSDAERQMAEVEYIDTLTEGGGLPPARAPGADRPNETHRLLLHYGDLARRFREIIGRRLVDSAAARAREAGVTQVRTMIEEGDPAPTILKLAQDQQVDVVVLGSRGLSDFKGLMLGSVSHKVAHLAECTCVTVR